MKNVIKAYAVVLVVAVLCLAYVMGSLVRTQRHNAAEARDVVLLSCGSYDVSIMPHDEQSQSDAEYAAQDLARTRDCVIVR